MNAIKNLFAFIVLAATIAPIMQAQTVVRATKEQRATINKYTAALTDLVQTIKQDVMQQNYPQSITLYNKLLAERQKTKAYKDMWPANKQAVEKAFVIATKLLYDTMSMFESIVAQYSETQPTQLIGTIENGLAKVDNDVKQAAGAANNLGTKITDSAGTKVIKAEAKEKLKDAQKIAEKAKKMSAGLLGSLKNFKKYLRSINNPA